MLDQRAHHLALYSLSRIEAFNCQDMEDTVVGWDSGDYLTEAKVDKIDSFDDPVQELPSIHGSARLTHNQRARREQGISLLVQRF